VKEVAVGIILNNGQVLVCQRRQGSPYPLKWEFPGGKLEPGESAAAALKRELREELNIDAEIGPRFNVQEWTYGDGMQDRDGAFRVHYFLVPAFAGQPGNKAFEQIQWVTPGDLQSMDILEGNRETVNLLASHAERKNKD
jgi:8-oxo-dGTP diphosphatase